MIELIDVLFQPVSICLFFFCHAGTDLSKCSNLYGISLIFVVCFFVCLFVCLFFFLWADQSALVGCFVTY